MDNSNLMVQDIVFTEISMYKLTNLIHFPHYQHHLHCQSPVTRIADHHCRQGLSQIRTSSTLSSAKLEIHGNCIETSISTLLMVPHSLLLWHVAFNKDIDREKFIWKKLLWPQTLIVKFLTNTYIRVWHPHHTVITYMVKLSEVYSASYRYNHKMNIRDTPEQATCFQLRSTLCNKPRDYLFILTSK